MSGQGFNQIGEQYGLKVDSTPKSLTLPLHPATNEKLTPHHALIWVADYPVRWSAHASPSTTSGMWVPANSYINWTEPGWSYYSFLARVKFLGIGGQATLDIVYLD